MEPFCYGDPLSKYVEWFYDRIRNGGKGLTGAFVMMEVDDPQISFKEDPSNSVEDYRKYNRAVLALLNEYGIRGKIRGVLLRDTGANKIASDNRWIDRICMKFLSGNPDPKWI